MKQLVTLLILLAGSCLQIHAQMRSESDMLGIAQSILGHSSGVQTKHQVKGQLKYTQDELKVLCRSNELGGLHDGKKQNTEFFRVYGYQDERPGFVVVSTDEQSCPVLGYSTTSRFSAEEMPEGLQRLLQLYTLRQQEARLTTKLLTPAVQAKVKSVEPLLGDIAFNQREPYNNLCPTLNGQHCLTGCVPTAMAQIMAYYKYPSRMNTEKGYINYVTKGGILAQWDVHNTVFDWDNIQPTYQAKEAGAYTGNNAMLNNESQLTISGLELSNEYKNYFCVYDLRNAGKENFVGEISLLICNTEGKVLGVASEKTGIELGQNWYYQMNYLLAALSANMPDGACRIYLASRRTGINTWEMVKNSMGGEVYLDAVKKRNIIEVGDRTLVCGYTDTQARAIATLCGACAHSIQAEFGVSSTPGSVLNMASSLVDYMGYSDRINYLNATSFSAEGWHQYLQEELQKYPLLASGFPNDGSAGHAFVIDGFEFNPDGIPYYHVNWGWNGMSNGYFLISYLKPSEAGDGGYEKNYAENLDILSHIHPADNDQTSNQFAVNDLIFSETNVTEGQRMYINASRFTNCTITTAYNTDLSVWAVSDDGRSYELDHFYTIRELGFRYYFNSLERSIVIPDNVPTGDYTIELHAIDNDHDLPTRVIMPTQRRLHISTSYTPVERIEADKASTSVHMYDLTGRPVNKAASRPGIVVKDGRKQVVTFK